MKVQIRIPIWPSQVSNVAKFLFILKTYLYNFDPIKLHFYINIIFLISAQNTDCGYSLDPPRRVLASTHNLCFEQKY